MDRRGELYELPGVLEIEWRIPKYYLHMDYESSAFCFAGTSWKLRLHTDAVQDDHNLCLDLSRLSFGSSLSLEVTVVRTVEEKRGQPKTDTYNYDDGVSSNLIAQWPGQHKSMMPPYSPPPSIILTCILKNKKPRKVTNHLSILADDLKYLREYKKDVDFTLNVQGVKCPVHRLILEARSRKFAQLLKENQTQELQIDDIEPYLMEIILDYIYKGDTNLITQFNVFPTYTVTEKYELEGLKQICSEYIEGNLTVDWLFEVLKFAEDQKAEEITYFGTQFFIENVAEITETSSWKTFSKEYKDKSIELLTYSVKGKMPKRDY